MPWTPLAERFSSLPLILAGPIVRRAEPHSISVWLALKAPRSVTLRVYQRDTGGALVQHLEGTHQTVRLGDHLHLVVVTAHAAHEHERLDWGGLYYYNLFFQALDASDAEESADLNTPGILTLDPSAADELHRLVYPGEPLPSFVLPAEDLNQLKLLHGSCRKPHGVGKEMLSAIDTMLADASRNQDKPTSRPQQLFMTGDQIYADDVATPLLLTLIDAGHFLFAGNKEEDLPLLQKPARLLAPRTRRDVVLNQALFTTTTPQNQLLAFAEYASMYLFAWSDVLWPDELPDITDLWQAYPETRPQPSEQQKATSAYTDSSERLSAFRSTLPQVRRALAHIATYMICDDHDVTDDWYLDGAWCQRVLGSPLGRRVVRNALLAYALFQAWGNTPHQFAGPTGLALLDAVNTWRGEASDAKQEVITHALGLPTFFEGSGALPRTEQALRWHYTFSGPRYQLIVMDTRTQRLYRTPHEFPGLLAPAAIERQIVAATREDAEVTIIVSAAPVLGVGFVEAIQFWSRLRIKDNYAYDREAWNLEWGTFQQFLCAVSPMKRVVFLSGDVHYAFGASLEFWDLARGTSASMVDFTSSPLHNESSGSQMAMFAVGYPYLYHLLRHTAMPTTDFFAWDIDASKRHIFRKMVQLIRSRMLVFWWSVPRLIDAMRSPYEIVLPARGWPAGSFREMPPDRSYRLHYLPDRLHSSAARDTEGKQAQALQLPHTGPGFNLQSLAYRVVTFMEAQLARTRRRLARRSLAARQETEKLPRGTRHIVRESIKGAERVERRLEKRKNKLANALLHREEWLSQWKAGNFIIGYANLGEIGFRWTPAAREVYQNLWWWHPANPSCATVATEYRETLDPPDISAAPPLP